MSALAIVIGALVCVGVGFLAALALCEWSLRAEEAEEALEDNAVGAPEAPAGLVGRWYPYTRQLVRKAYLAGAAAAAGRPLEHAGRQALEEQGAAVLDSIAEHLARTATHAYGEGARQLEAALRRRTGLEDAAIEEACSWALEHAVADAIGRAPIGPDGREVAE